MSRENLRRTPITIAFLCLIFFVDVVVRHVDEQTYRALGARMPLLTSLWTFALGCIRGN